jgi:hypothetical protein
MKYAILVAGTSEVNVNSGTMPVGMLKGVVDKLDKSKWTAYSVPYISQYAGDYSYLESLRDGIAKTKRAIDQLPAGASFVLLGYSQGATIAGDVARDIGLGLYDLKGKAFLGVYLISDPRQNSGDLVGPAVPGYGITGERGSLGSTHDRIYEFCAPGDLICSTDRSSNLIHLVVPYTTKFALRDPAAWVRGMIDYIRDPKNDLRKMYPDLFQGVTGWLRFKNRLNVTIKSVKYYLDSKVHLRYGTYQVAPGVTTLEWIAAHMNGLK